MKNRLAQYVKVVGYIGTYIIEFVGMALIATGVGMIYRPAGVITAGVIAVALVEIRA